MFDGPRVSRKKKKKKRKEKQCEPAFERSKDETGDHMYHAKNNEHNFTIRQKEIQVSKLIHQRLKSVN